MNEFQQKFQNRSALLDKAYEAERVRLAAFLATDTPQGDYACPVFGEGSAADGCVLFVGEAPGRDEAANGRPFVGKAGKQLDTLLRLAGIPRESVYITNAVKYRPVVRSKKSVRNRTPGTKEIVEALPLLRFEISTVCPCCIVTLGNTPLGAILQLSGLDKRTVGELHGHALPLDIDGCASVLFPLYHPASGIYNRSLVPVMEQDIRSLGEHLVKAR